MGLARRLREEESGQALVLGAVAMLVLALGVMSTVQLGHAIHERMALQDAADNAAYSAATVAARSLNGIAWINRTMIAQYVAAMSVQSMVAALDGIQAFVGLAADLLQTMAAGACATQIALDACCATGVGSAACCSGAALLATLGPPLADGAAALRQSADAVGDLERKLDPEAAKFVRFVSDLNFRGLYAAQLALREATAAALAAPARSFVRQVLTETSSGRVNESARGRRYDRVMGEYNAASYARTFDRAGSEAIPPGGGTREEAYTDASAQQSAERLMAELTNASRTPWESGHGLSQSGSGGVLGRVGAAVAAALRSEQVGATRLVDPMEKTVFVEEGRPREPAKAASSGGTAAAYGSDRAAYGGQKNSVFMNYTYASEFTRGFALASAEYAHLAFLSGPISGERGARVVGIQATSNPKERLHCRYDGRELRTLVPGCPPYASTRPIRCDEEPQHEFWGMTRYLSMALEEDPGRAFNQPDFIVLANRSAADARFPVDLGMGFGGEALRFTVGDTGATFDPELGRRALGGIHAWARAEAYYHRPGAWAEPPNLFNPFWRARLAPVAPRARLLETATELGATGSLARLFDRALVH